MSVSTFVRCAFTTPGAFRCSHILERCRKHCCARDVHCATGNLRSSSSTSLLRTVALLRAVTSQPQRATGVLASVYIKALAVPRFCITFFFTILRSPFALCVSMSLSRLRWCALTAARSVFTFAFNS
jgi:hypothetical protein